MNCTYVVVGVIGCGVDGGNHGTGRRTCAKNVGQDSVSSLSRRGKASGCVGGRAGTIINRGGCCLNALGKGREL